MKRSFFSLVTAVVLLLSAVACQKNLNGIDGNIQSDKSANALSGAAFLSPEIVRFDPNPITAGDSTEVFVKLSQPAPAGGIVVTLDKVRSAGPVVSLPAKFVIAEGEKAGSVFIHTIPYKDSIAEYISASLPSFESSSPQYLLIIPRPISDPRPALQFFEAENANLTGVVAKQATGLARNFFSNAAFAQYEDVKKSYALFNVTPSRAGENILEFRYAWSTSVNQQPQQLTVKVNGTTYPLLFTPTATDHSNNLIFIRANLKAGNNKIYVGTRSGNAAKLRLDNLTVAVP